MDVQNCSSEGFPCIKIQSLYFKIPECARAHGFSAAQIAATLFFRTQNRPPKVFPRPKQPAQGFSAAKIARPVFFRSQNSPPRFFPQPYTEFLHIVSSKLGRIYLPRMRRAGLACRLAWNFPAGRANMAGLVSGCSSVRVGFP